MAGHSKWANTKHRKERADKKKGKLFSRIMKEIISAVKQGGPDPKANAKLKAAIQKAKDANVPNENVDRNIKKAASPDQQDYTPMTYELYGFGGVGLLVDILSDNKNRISSEIRIATNKCGGTIASPGSVSYNFDRKSFFRVKKGSFAEDDLFLLAMEHGADDFRVEEESYLITGPVEAFHALREALMTAGATLEEAELAFVPKTLVPVSDEIANQNIALIEYLEGLDDVDAVYHNMAIDV
jgi:YebC/PmpR family DNA-binding regulatory protein